MSNGLSAPRIISAAMKIPGGNIICSPRHWDSVAHMQVNNSLQHEVWKREAVQGFVDQHCQFYTRQEAWIVATRQNQIVRRVGGDEGILYSENLY